MKQFKRAQVILLPTEQRSHIILDTRVNELQYHTLDKNNDDYQDKTIKTFHHLYIISDDEIKEGEYGIGYAVGIRGVGAKHFVFKNEDKVGKLQSICNGAKKIIATTDTALKTTIQCNIGLGYIEMTESLPQPSQQFIQKYIESYNNGVIITEVLVEYEEGKTTYKILSGNPYYTTEYKLKVNPKDNTITIKKLKDSWNKEEVIEILKQFNDRHNTFFFGKDKETLVNNWIEQNL